MLTIRWDTLVVIAVIGLTASYLVMRALLRVSAARLIDALRDARSADEPSRSVVHRSTRLALYRGDDANVPTHSPSQRQAS